MRALYLLLLIFVPTVATGAVVDLTGTWQGIILRDGQVEKEADILYLSIQANNGTFAGKSRMEAYKTDYYIVHTLKGTLTGKDLRFEQGVAVKKKSTSSISWCDLIASLHYEDSTGYLVGTFTSKSCRRQTGRLVLFRINAAFSESDQPIAMHGWRDIFLDDLRNGRKSPEVRNLERKNFQFQPIYFDSDEAIIKPEFHPFLRRMIAVVNGHSDLRIKITGHTDADGSDAYNEQLSKRRAEALKAFFVANGLPANKLLIDFKGEKIPVDNNSTPEGKQRNRRVDFEFI